VSNGTEVTVTGFQFLLGRVPGFNLDRRVINAKTVMGDPPDPSKDIGPRFGAIANNHMTAHRDDSRCQRSHVEVMNRLDAIRTGQVVLKSHQVDMGRRSFQQNVDCTTDESPGTR